MDVSYLGCARYGNVLEQELTMQKSQKYGLIEIIYAWSISI
jgi:hypothetical protein